MNYVRLRPRSWPLKQDEQKRKDFQKKLNELEKNSEIEIWYQDECGVMGDSKPRCILAKKGTKPVIFYTGSHIRENVIGAVRPKDGKFISLIMPEINTNTFQMFIDEIQQYTSKNKKIIMILDNAAWHKTKVLNWGKIEPFFLPPYSPDFNPIERIWLDMKEKFFSYCFVAKTREQLLSRLMFALVFYYNNPNNCISLCRRFNRVI